MTALKPSAKAIYKDSAGNRLPGATTIIDIISKPQLIIWANRLGLQGIDSTKYTDNLADVGTLAHHIILCKHRGMQPDMSDFSQNQIDLAMNSIRAYVTWEQQYKINPILVETPLISESLRYGGTPDLYCMLDGMPTLLDFKTGKALYTEVMYQLAAYKHLLEEQGYPVQHCIALRIGREEGEGFEVKEGYNLELAFSIFKHCLDLYYQIKEYKKESK